MNCHSAPNHTCSSQGSIALVGHPNVGKSVIFQALTGQRAMVANYPGTTVEIARAALRGRPQTTLVDTPGVIALPPHSEDERVTARLLLDEPLQAIVQVGDAKNLRRTLLLTAQLAEFGRPLILALNLADEAEAQGLRINAAALSERLGLPVVLTTAVKGKGLPTLAAGLERENGWAAPPAFRLHYPPEIERAAARIAAALGEALPGVAPAPRALALMWLSGDPAAEDWLRARLKPELLQEWTGLRENLQLSFVSPLAEVIQRIRLDFAAAAAEVGTAWGAAAASGGGTWLWPGGHAPLAALTLDPLWGWFILAAVLYALYWFVGVFGAGTLVGLLENGLFGEHINPWLLAQAARLPLPPVLVDFLLGQYGLWTMGVTYALALILPVVTTFFLAFGLLEDSGYLPRLAALSNRLFAALGLNGKAILPMVLGLGCVTMATLTTRVMESRRERLLVTLLLALAVPCSAQLGVVMGMLAGVSFTAALIWAGVVALVLLAVGWLAARLLPGERSALLVELPPLRWPAASNVTLKTLARLEWYLKEVVPLFLLGAALLFGLDRLGALAWINRALEPLVTGWLGLPAEASAALLLGFMRRDFGATGLFVMAQDGLLTPVQVVTAMVTITLFIPCIASVMVIAKEHGSRTAAGMTALILPLAFLVGGLLYRLLGLFGWGG